MKYFRRFSRQDLLSRTKLRRFVTRVGERVLVPAKNEDLNETLASTSAKYILFGIPEDIGIKANYGIGGAASAWEPFLGAFLNVQCNDFFSGEEVLLLGCFDFNELMFLIEEKAKGEDEKADAFRHAVVSIDENVEVLAKLIASHGKIPIAIGGGHNNAYPLIRGTAKGLYHAEKIPLAQINAINLDAHTDYRPAEGRHSGNGFRYAEEDGVLLKYYILGLHENHLPQNVWVDIADNPFIDFVTYEDIFLREKMNFTQALAHGVAFTEDNYTGIELDLDCIENVLSSAATPSGITVLQARQYMRYTSERCKIAYLHICEGVSRMDDGQTSDTTGKLISYLVTDFIKGN